MKKLTEERRREIENEIVSISDYLFSLCEETGLLIDIAHYNQKKDSPCISFHNGETCYVVVKRSDIFGLFDNEEFKEKGFYETN